MINSNDVRDEKVRAVVVAGGGAWWGRSLCESLVKKGLEVTGVDDVKGEGREKWGSFEYLFFLESGETKGKSLALLRRAAGLKEFLEEAEKQQAKFLLVSDLSVFEGEVVTRKVTEVDEERMGGLSRGEAKRFGESLVTAWVREKKGNGRIVRLGTVYGPGQSEEDWPLGYLINRARKGERVEMAGLPGVVYPVWVDDAVRGIEKAMFGSGTCGAVVTLASEKAVVVRKVVELLERKAGKRIGVGEVSKEVQPEISGEVLEAGKKLISWEPEVEIEEGIERMWGEETKKEVAKEPQPSREAMVGEGRAEAAVKILFRSKKEEGKEKISVERRAESLGEKKKEVNWSRRISVGLLVVLLGLVGYVWLVPLVAICGGGWWAYQAVVNLEKEPVESEKLAGRASEWFMVAEKGGERLTEWPGGGILGWWYKDWAVLGEETAEGVAAGSRAWMNVVAVTGSLGRGEVGVEEAQQDIERVRETLSFWQVKVAGGLPWPGNWWWQKYGKQEELTKGLKYLSWVKEMLPGWGEMVGISGRRSYVVLLQNNLELRPTGGFIGSFAIVTFERGKMIDFQVMDSYTADAQLGGHVEPPAAIKKYLGETGWYLRDANWDPDFGVSAARVEWFLEKELGRKVDGVVGVNLEFLRRLLEVTGPVELAGYGERITAENLLERVEYSPSANVLPGVGQKGELVGAVASEMVMKLGKGGVDGKRLGVAVGEALAAKEIMVYWRDEKLRQVAANLGWDGSLRRARCEAGVICDRVAVIDANVGVNKVNYFVKQTADYGVDLTNEGKVVAKLDLEYKNTATSENFPAGRLKDYVRVLVPEGVVMEKVEVVDGETGERVLYKETQIDSEKIAGWSVFGLIVEVPINSSRRVEMSYSFEREKEATAYRLAWLAQSGKKWERVAVKVKYPPEWRPVATEPSALTVGGELLYNVDLTSDRVLGVQFAKI